MAGLLGELLLEEGVRDSVSGTESGPPEARSFAFDHDKEVKLPVDASIKQAPA